MTEDSDELDIISRVLIDEKRGMLTQSDREFLRGVGDEYVDDPNARNQKRYQIRQRVRRALQDFWFLDGLPEKDIRLIFGDYFYGDFEDDETLAFSMGVWTAMKFLYVSLGEDEFIHLTEELIEIDRHERQRDTFFDASIEIKIEETGSLAEGLFGREDYEGPADTELTDAVIEIIEELEEEGGDGVKTGEVIEAITTRKRVSEEDANQAIDDAILTGRCYPRAKGEILELPDRDFETDI